MRILGISAFYHDSAAVLLDKGQIIAAAQEERFTRKKHDSSFPVNAVEYCLAQIGGDASQLDHIIFYDKPLLKFLRLLDTQLAFAPLGAPAFRAFMPVWLKDKLFLNSEIENQLRKLSSDARELPPVSYCAHHLSHAASAFFPSPFEEAAILTIDGVGEWITTSIGLGKGNNITSLKELHFPHSWGLLYSAFTYYLGFTVNSGEYKIMGLAPYGQPDSERVNTFKRLIRQEMIEILPDGAIWLNMDYFSFATHLQMTNDKSWAKLFRISRRRPEEQLRQEHMDMALAIQELLEEGVILLTREARRITGARNLVMAGGVALNCVANERIRNLGLFDNIWIQPAAGDAGGALGAAMAAWHIGAQKPRRITESRDLMQASLLGPGYHEQQIEIILKKFNAHFSRAQDEGALDAQIAQELADGRVVGWFQGRMEWGPRALGNRSILADPRNSEMQKILNLKIKSRESFRPFAPAVLEEECANYFNASGPSPYMLFTAPITETKRRTNTFKSENADPAQRLSQIRSEIPAVTHLDYSARVQTVGRQSHPRFWQLLQAFQKRTGCPVLINTSFNVRGEPIVCTPEDALRCFMTTAMDILAIGPFILYKNDQTDFKINLFQNRTLGLD